MARAGWPVLMREEGAPVLSAKGVTVRGLTAERMRLASGETTHEDDLRSPADGEGSWNPLCLGAEHKTGGADGARRTTEDFNEPA